MYRLGRILAWLIGVGGTAYIAVGTWSEGCLVQHGLLGISPHNAACDFHDPMAVALLIPATAAVGLFWIPLLVFPRIAGRLRPRDPC